MVQWLEKTIFHFLKKGKKKRKTKNIAKKKFKKNQFQTSPTTVKLKSQHNWETNDPQ